MEKENSYGIPLAHKPVNFLALIYILKIYFEPWQDVEVFFWVSPFITWVNNVLVSQTNNALVDDTFKNSLYLVETSVCLAKEMSLAMFAVLLSRCGAASVWPLVLRLVLH